ncbi:MAG: hypothetical protein IPL99_26385 [Candidatus Competibacteraceae bacterium]|nr:hypothetical protein [Candidatus Competibacteraceae bacterium]
MTDLDAFTDWARTSPPRRAKVCLPERDESQLLQWDHYTGCVQKLVAGFPPINKFYIMDLRSGKFTLIKWCVDQGFTVFLMSWINQTRRWPKKPTTTI